MTTFFILMALYPEVQKQAQAEIEQVTAGRLPTLDNYESLPYVIALVKEIMRWGPSLALSKRRKFNRIVLRRPLKIILPHRPPS